MCLYLGQAKLFGSEISKSKICGLKFWEGEITWSLIFLVAHCPSHFLSIKLFLETGQLIIWGL